MSLLVSAIVIFLSLVLSAFARRSMLNYLRDDQNYWEKTLKKTIEQSPKRDADWLAMEFSQRVDSIQCVGTLIATLPIAMQINDSFILGCIWMIFCGIVYFVFDMMIKKGKYISLNLLIDNEKYRVFSWATPGLIVTSVVYVILALLPYPQPQ